MKNSLLTPVKSIKLIPVPKNVEKENSSKMIGIKRSDKKSNILLPPQQQGYIKARKHDFL
jgi:hypothetical protein